VSAKKNRPTFEFLVPRRSLIARSDLLAPTRGFATFGPSTHLGTEPMSVEIIICVTGPGDTGKSTIIRELTAAHLNYQRAEGDVLGIFPMPWRNYAVGVNGSGDNLQVIREGLDFLNRYDRLRVMIAASRSRGATFEEVERFAINEDAILHRVETEKLTRPRWEAAISAKVLEIFRLMPGRDERDA
jgi:hypothetical protein